MVESYLMELSCSMFQICFIIQSSIGQSVKFLSKHVSMSAGLELVTIIRLKLNQSELD